MSNLERLIPEKIRHTASLRLFGLAKIPLLFFLSPSVIELSNTRCVVKIPLTYRSRNHLKSMYFGALAAGADCATGLLAFYMMEKLHSRNKISLIFKSFHADYLKRAEDDVHFVCESGLILSQLVHDALESGERVELKVPSHAIVPNKFGDEPIAKFELTISLKRKS